MIIERYAFVDLLGLGFVYGIVDQRNKTIIGVHMIGNPCSEFVAAASFAVRMGYTVGEFKQVVFPHPTVGEVLREVIAEL